MTDTPLHAGMRLTAEWLSKEQADSLAQQLLGLWKEQGPGCPVCFTWTDWLQNDALPFLGVTDTLLLTFDPRAVPATASSPLSLAAGEHRLNSHQGMHQACELDPHSKPSADSLQPNGSASEQSAHNTSCLQASGRTLTPSSSHKDNRHGPDAAGANSASVATGKQAARTGSQGELASESSASRQDARRPGRRRQRGGPQRGPALDPKAAAWQPPDGLEALSLPEHSTEQQPSHCLQRRGLAHAQQSKQAVLYPVVARTPSPVVDGQAEGSENSSTAHNTAQDRENGSVEGEAEESVAAGSSTAGSSPPKTSGSDLERVVQLYMRLTAYSKGRERQLFQEASPVLQVPIVNMGRTVSV